MTEGRSPPSSVCADAAAVIAPYTPADSDAAMLLERRSPQGSAFRLRFDRPYFHRRAENFDRWQLLTARLDGTLVGIGGAALKPVAFEGRQTTALYMFDVRVAPQLRRRGVAQQLIAGLREWGAGEAELAYGLVAGDNDAARRLTEDWFGAAATPACAFLVYPTYKAGTRRQHTRPESPGAVHAAFVAAQGPFAFYANPAAAFSSEGYVASWVHGDGASRAGCSAWSNANIFAEVVERVPRSMAVLGSVLRTWPLTRLGGPPLPRRGERLRSWYIFDGYATDGAAAARLMSDVAADARAQGIDYCYIIHRPGEAWAGALRRTFPAPLAPIIPYSMVARQISGAAVSVPSPYIDIRDV